VSAPAPSRRPRPVARLPVVVAVVAALLVGGLVDRLAAQPAAPAGVPAGPAAAAPADAESSSWYCAGGTSAAGGAPATVFLANAGPAPVSGTFSVVDDAGATTSVVVTVPAHGELAEQPAGLSSGNYLAARVDLDGGGVAVSESVGASGGWAEAPCASATGTSWYFTSASTRHALDYLSLYNPAMTAAVVDLTFVTASGATSPQPYQGLVVAPGSLVVLGVNNYVQDVSGVATLVQAQSGRIVAAQLVQSFAGGVSGVSLQSGAASPDPSWTFPRSADVAGGRTEFDVLNPTTAPERVSVAFRLPSGPVAPLTASVPALSTWVVPASTLPRLPPGTDYATTVTSTGGPGVVVGRVVVGPPTGVVPQWGAVTGLVGVAGAASKAWLLTAPVAGGGEATSGVAPLGLGIENPIGAPVVVEVEALTGGPRGVAPVPGGSFTLAPHGFTVVASSLPVADPLLVTGTGPLAVMEDLVPAALAGVVSLPALALTADPGT